MRVIDTKQQQQSAGKQASAYQQTTRTPARIYKHIYTNAQHTNTPHHTYAYIVYVAATDCRSAPNHMRPSSLPAVCVMHKAHV